MDPLEQLNKTLEQASALEAQFTKGRATEDDVVEVFGVIISLMKEVSSELDKAVIQGDKDNYDYCSEQYEKLKEAQDRMGRLIVQFKENTQEGIDELAYQVFTEIKTVKSMIPEVKDWAYLETKIDQVEQRIPIVPEEVDAIQLRDKLESLEGDERTDKSAIKGIEEIEEKIKKIEIRPSGRGEGGTRGFQLYVDGSKKGIVNYLNLIAGTGVTLSYNRANGRNDITISATGGTGSLAIILVTGSINDSNTSFVAASAPQLVVINGAPYRNGRGVTISGTSITTEYPVGVGGDIYAL